MNPGPLAPQASALARLRHGPNSSILAQDFAWPRKSHRARRIIFKSRPAPLSRRSFIKTSAGATAIATPGILRAQNTNSAVHVGWIAQVTAVCDTYTGNLARGQDRLQNMGGNTPKTFADYLQLLQDPAIDAVVITTLSLRNNKKILRDNQARKYHFA